MEVTIVSIGKGKLGAEGDLYERYVKRTPWKIKLVEKKELSDLSGDKKKQEEGKLLLEGAAKAERIVALDETGKQLTSPEFAGQISRWKNESIHHIAFLIGGSDGLSDEVRKRAHLTFSFGKLTWPHFLVRGLLAEQLYRAHTIIENHQYHRI